MSTRESIAPDEESKAAETDAGDIPYERMGPEGDSTEKEVRRIESILIRSVVKVVREKEPIIVEKELKERMDSLGIPIRHCKDWRRNEHQTDHHIAFHTDLVKIEEVESYKQYNYVEPHSSFCMECVREFCVLF
jgi:hypothetical protein